MPAVACGMMLDGQSVIAMLVAEGSSKACDRHQNGYGKRTNITNTRHAGGTKAPIAIHQSERNGRWLPRWCADDEMCSSPRVCRCAPA